MSALTKEDIDILEWDEKKIENYLLIEDMIGMTLSFLKTRFQKIVLFIAMTSVEVVFLLTIRSETS